MTEGFRKLRSGSTCNPLTARVDAYRKMACKAILTFELFVLILVQRRTSNLPCQSTHFVGRDAVVNQIKEKLTSNSSRMIVLIALPGMGKTEVVIRVGGLLVKEHWPVVYVKEKKLIDICQEILYQVDYRHWTVPMSQGDEISHCKRKLSELEDETIIILDNAEDLQKEEEFNDFFEHLVRSAPKVRTIIATRYDITSLILASGDKIRLDPLDLSSSSKLLMQRAPQISKPHAEEIGDLCGGVPLFLVCQRRLSNAKRTLTLLPNLAYVSYSR